MTRVSAQLARCTGSTACNRCPAPVAVHAGRWHAVEAKEAHLAVCDACAETHDPAGYGALLAWRRASAQPAIGRRS